MEQSPWVVVRCDSAQETFKVVFLNIGCCCADKPVDHLREEAEEPCRDSSTKSETSLHEVSKVELEFEKPRITTAETMCRNASAKSILQSKQPTFTTVSIALYRRQETGVFDV